MAKKQDLQKKLMANSIILEKVVKLSPEEKQKVITKLLEGKSERELGEELGIPHSTIHDWKTLRQCNKGELIHISMANIVKKIRIFEPKTSVDYMYLQSIKKIVTEKLKK